MNFKVKILISSSLLFCTLFYVCSFQESFVSFNHSFTLNEEYHVVRNAIIRGNSLRTIVESNNGKLLKDEWLDFKISILKIKPPRQWEVFGRGRFFVEYNDSHIGREVVEMNQEVIVSEDEILVNVALSEPGKRLKQYKTVMQIKKIDQGKTEISTNIEIGVKVFAPKLFIKKEKLNYLLQKAATNNLKNSESVLRKIVDQNRGFSFEIPIKDF